MTHFRSISMMTKFKGKEKEKNKLAIYTEKFQSPPASRASATAGFDCSKKWIVIAVETDAEFPSGNTFLGTLSHVQYIFDLNFGINVYFKWKLWNSSEPLYPYSGLPTVSIPVSNATRTNIVDLFTAFETKGWGRNQTCNMMHLLTGKKLGTSGGPYGGDSRNRQIDCASRQVAASLSSFEFLSESIDQIARVMAHELGHSLAATGSHEQDSPYNGVCLDAVTGYHSVTNTTPNTIMCVSFRENSASDQLIGARTPYFSTSFQNDILAKVASVTICLQSPPAPTFGQAYFNGSAITNTPYFANTRNATLATDINYQVTPAFDRSVTPGTVFLGSPSVTENPILPNFSGIFTFNAPGNVNNATFFLTATGLCGATAIRSIPVVFGSAYRLYPNPAQSNLTVEFLLDKEPANPIDFLPELVVLLDEKNKEMKRSEPKKNAKASNDPTKLAWDLADVAAGTYFPHISYGKEVVFKEKILIQK